MTPTSSLSFEHRHVQMTCVHRPSSTIAVVAAFDRGNIRMWTNFFVWLIAVEIAFPVAVE